jgi:hypothetical protein
MEDVKSLIDLVSGESKARFVLDTNDVFNQIKDRFVKQYASELDGKLKTMISYDAAGWKLPQTAPLASIKSAITDLKAHQTTTSYISKLFDNNYNALKPVKVLFLWHGNGRDPCHIDCCVIWSINGTMTLLDHSHWNESRIPSYIHQSTGGFDIPEWIFDLFDSLLLVKSYYNRSTITTKYIDNDKRTGMYDGIRYINVKHNTHDNDPYKINLDTILMINKFAKSFQEVNLTTPFNARGRALVADNERMRLEVAAAVARAAAAELKCKENEAEMDQFENWREQVAETNQLNQALLVKQEKIKLLAASLKSRERDLSIREKKLADREADFAISGHDIDDILG